MVRAALSEHLKGRSGQVAAPDGNPGPRALPPPPVRADGSALASADQRANSQNHWFLFPVLHGAIVRYCPEPLLLRQVPVCLFFSTP